MQLVDQVSRVLLRIAVLAGLVAQTLQLRPISREALKPAQLGKVQLVTGATTVHVLCRFKVELVLMNLRRQKPRVFSDSDCSCCLVTESCNYLRLAP